MRKYASNDEKAIRIERLVREWTRSGLLEKAQEQRILPELRVDLRRTNLFLRLVMFAFGLLIIGSSVLLVGVTLKLNEEVPVAILCLVGATGSFALSEYLIARFRVYRFGIEEAAAVAGAALLIIAAGVLVSLTHVTGQGEFAILIGLIVGAIAGWTIYIRFGYLYAAIAAMLCMSLAPFQTGTSQITERLASALLLLLVFVVAHLKHRESGDEFPGDEYGLIQAIAWLGFYASLNLQLSSLGSAFRLPTLTGPFYWFTYVAVWLIPIVGIFISLRERARPLFDVSLALCLVTLTTNKLYLGVARQSWDPIILGVLLIGTALALRRWLSSADCNGFTAARILLSDKPPIFAIGAASAALYPVPRMPADSVPVRNLEPGGGRSGGAGASSSF
jgi:hypothetical protein